MKWLYLLLILLLVPLVSSIPEIPHLFDGSVSDSDGSISSGFVSAKLCNKQFTAPILNGHYESLLVSREDCSNTNIEFFVNGYKTRDYIYVSGGITNLNLYLSDQDNDPYVPQSNPPIDNNPTNTQTNDNSDNNGGRERPSRKQPPPEDLIFDSDAEQDSVDNLQMTNPISTGKMVSNALLKTKLGNASLVIIGVSIILGLIFLLKLTLFI